jgi:hypothetical protein
VRNVCLMRLRQRRKIPTTDIEIHDTVPGPEQALERHALHDWVWKALARLSLDERVTVMLRHFSRCNSYEAIAQITDGPVETAANPGVTCQFALPLVSLNQQPALTSIMRLSPRWCPWTSACITR